MGEHIKFHSKAIQNKGIKPFLLSILCLVFGCITMFGQVGSSRVNNLESKQNKGQSFFSNKTMGQSSLVSNATTIKVKEKGLCKLTAKYKDNDEKIIARLQKLADSLLKARGIPALGFGIIKDGKVILNEGFGYRDYENKLKTDANTMFAIGSCTKAFTAATVAILNDKELIEWDKPVKNYMPDFELYDKFATQETTALDLLTHRSGLPRHDLIWYGSNAKRMELYSRLKFLEPTKSFRTTFQYQNLMYMTAGVLVEKMSGMTWEDYTKSQIIDPIGMSQTHFSTEKSKKMKNVAYPYTIENGSAKRINFRNIEEVGPAGSINSNINDMLKWVELNLNRGTWEGEQIISDEQFEVLHKGHITIDNSLGNRLQPEYGPFTYGGGWFICEYKGEKIIWHGGGIDGFSALVWLIPEFNIGMVLICNVMSSSLPRVLANYASDLFLGLESPYDWVENAWPSQKNNESNNQDNTLEERDKDKILNTKPSQPLVNFTGTYTNPGYGKIYCKFKEGNLNVEYNSLYLQLSHYHFDVFEGLDIKNKTTRFKIQFHQNLDGSIKYLSVPLQSGIDPILFKKSDK